LATGVSQLGTNMSAEPDDETDSKERASPISRFCMQICGRHWMGRAVLRSSSLQCLGFLITLMCLSYSLMRTVTVPTDSLPLGDSAGEAQHEPASTLVAAAQLSAHGSDNQFMKSAAAVASAPASSPDTPSIAVDPESANASPLRDNVADAAKPSGAAGLGHSAATTMTTASRESFSLKLFEPTQEDPYCEPLSGCYHQCKVLSPQAECPSSSCCPELSTVGDENPSVAFANRSKGFYECKLSDSRPTSVFRQCMKRCNGRSAKSCKEDNVYRRECCMKPQQRRCVGVTFLRIQKTGSTTWFRSLRRIGRLHGQQCDKGDVAPHLNFNGAFRQAMSHETGPSCVFTMLRDPVERTMSEFFFLRGSKAYFTHPQWDYPDSQMLRLNHTLKQANVSQAFLDFLHFPDSPVRNRQSLYLLGFDRVSCTRDPKTFQDLMGPPVKFKGRWPGDDKNITCSDTDPAVPPGRQHDWEGQHETLVERVKEQLQKITAWGLTECFSDSWRPIAQNLDWHEDVVSHIADGIHGREQDKSKLDLASLKPSVEFSQRWHKENPGLVVTKPSEKQQGYSYRYALDPILVKEIEHVNRVDVELIKFARDEFFKKHGRKCAEPMQ